jgi:tetratricopeptide (TPR) repeat protein
VAALRRAEDSAAGGTPTEATRAELAAARSVVDDLLRHAHFIAAVSDNLQWYAEEFNDRKDKDRFETSYCARHADALRRFGLDALNSPEDEVARAVAASRIRDSLLGLLLEWHQHALNPSATRRHPDPSDPAPTARLAEDRLGRVIRSARLLSGGAYGRWQELLDKKDLPGLVAFAASPDGLSFRSTLVRALGRDLVRAGQHGACQAFLRAAVDRYPHDAWLHVDLSDACRALGPANFLEALRHASAACVLQPGSAVFHFRVGTRYFDLRSNPQAAAAFRKSIALRPESPMVLNHLGNVLSEMHEWDGAVAAFREVLRLEPIDDRARDGLITTLAKAGRHAEARQLPLDWRQQAASTDLRAALSIDSAGSLIECATPVREAGYDPSPVERELYRRQALGLLTDSLAAIRTRPANDRARVHLLMRTWLDSPDLVPVRDPAAVGLLPPDERDAWNKLWADVRDLHDRTATTPEAGKK